MDNSKAFRNRSGRKPVNLIDNKWYPVSFKDMGCPMVFNTPFGYMEDFLAICKIQKRLHKDLKYIKPVIGKEIRKWDKITYCKIFPDSGNIISLDKVLGENNPESQYRRRRLEDFSKQKKSIHPRLILYRRTDPTIKKGLSRFINNLELMRITYMGFKLIYIPRVNKFRMVKQQEWDLMPKFISKEECPYLSDIKKIMDEIIKTNRHIITEKKRILVENCNKGTNDKVYVCYLTLKYINHLFLVKSR